MSLSTTDPRKLYRLTPQERALIVAALEEVAEVHLNDGEREVAAQIIVRMS
jgi:DNA-binding HxlR family transcriptional regulator